MKTLYLSITPLLIFSSSTLVAQAMLTPFSGHTLTQDFVDEQLRAHQDWIAVSSTNSSQDYVGPGQCSLFFNLNMRQGSLAYPHLNDVQLDLLTPTKIIENQTMPMQLQVTNNENYTLYNVTMLDWAGNEFFDLGNLSEIYVLEPHQSKTITGRLTFATKNGITCFHYNGGESRPALGYQISAKNQTGTMVESHYFNSEIAVKILSPLEQFNLGIPTENVECNQGLQFMIRNGDGTPVCVKPESVGKLVDRGWGALPLDGLPTSGPFVGNLTNSSSLTNHTLPASFIPCDTPFPQSNTGIPMLYIQTNSIGKICVVYSNSDNMSYPVGITFFDANNIHQNATDITTWNDMGNTNGTISKGNSFVVYWIKTGNQSRLYGLSFFCSTWNPMAVGYDGNSNLTENDFPFLRETMPCPMQPYQLHIDSTTGIGVKYIPYP